MSSLLLGGEVALKVMRDRACRRGGEPDSDRVERCRGCFSLVRLALSSVISQGTLVAVAALRRRRATGVFGSAKAAAVALVVAMLVLGFVAAATTCFAIWLLAWRISAIVSPRSIAGSDIRRQSPVF